MLEVNASELITVKIKDTQVGKFMAQVDLKELIVEQIKLGDALKRFDRDGLKRIAVDE